MPNRIRMPLPRLMMLLAMTSATTGCAPKGDVFSTLDTLPVWPAPPAPARIRYIGELESSRDLKAAVTLGEVFFGEESARSMLTPMAVCTDRRGRVFVADSNGQMVHVFDLDNRHYDQWTLPEGSQQFAQPVGIVVDPYGRVLVADSVAGTIFRFNEDGEFLGELGVDHLRRPTGLAIDATRERLFVADPGTHEIVVLDLDGRFLNRFGGRGIALGQFNYPTSVAVDAQGRVFVSDSLNFRVQVFDADLTPLRQIGRHGDMPGYFAQPKGIALDREGHVYVVDAQFEAVQIFDADGTLLLSFGREGTGPGEFWLPAGIHIDSTDRVWVADAYNRRIQVFQYLTEASP